MRIHATLLLSACTLLLAAGAAAIQAATPAGDLESRRAALKALLDEHWQFTLRTNPEVASFLGDKRYNDQLSDASEAGVELQLAKSRELLTRFEAVDTAGFSEQEALDKALMVRNLRETLAGARFKNWEMPVNQLGGIHLNMPELVALLTFTSVKDYDDLVARYRHLPAAFAQTVDTMRKGMADGLMPPRFLLEKVADQAAAIASQKPEDSSFAEPLKSFPAAVPAGEQGRIREATIAAIRDDVLPAYRR
jgi:uncharacterized protein (DUF885 family)